MINSTLHNLYTRDSRNEGTVRISDTTSPQLMLANTTSFPHSGRKWLTITSAVCSVQCAVCSVQCVVRGSCISPGAGPPVSPGIDSGHDINPEYNDSPGSYGRAWQINRSSASFLTELPTRGLSPTLHRGLSSKLFADFCRSAFVIISGYFLLSVLSFSIAYPNKTLVLPCGVQYFCSCFAEAQGLSIAPSFIINRYFLSSARWHRASAYQPTASAVNKTNHQPTQPTSIVHIQFFRAESR